MVTQSDIQIADIADTFNALTETEYAALTFTSQAYNHDGTLVDVGTPWAMGFEATEQEVQAVEYCD